MAVTLSGDSHWRRPCYKVIVRVVASLDAVAHCTRRPDSMELRCELGSVGSNGMPNGAKQINSFAGARSWLPSCCGAADHRCSLTDAATDARRGASACSEGCRASDVGDGFCDAGCRVAACEFDKGDCDGCEDGEGGHCTTEAKQSAVCRQYALAHWTKPQLASVGCVEELPVSGGDYGDPASHLYVLSGACPFPALTTLATVVWLVADFAMKHMYVSLST